LEPLAESWRVSTATIEQFESDPTSLLAAVEQGEAILISRGAKPVARLLPVEQAESFTIEREDWLRAAEHNLARAYGPNEPDYRPAQIVEPNPDYQP
jgi:prevent-host-death family protein